eukprot:264511_1
MAEIISRLQKKDQAKLKRSKSIYAQSQLKHKHNNKRSQPVIAPPLHNASFEASTALNTPFISHMTIKDAHNLFFGAVIDHRDRFGRFMFARVVGRNGTDIQVIHYGKTQKHTYTCDYTQQLYRFAYPGSISLRGAHRMTTVTKGDLVRVNPKHRHPGWTYGRIQKFDSTSGQVKVVYEYSNSRYLYWVHLDDQSEIAPVDAQKENEMQSEIMNNKIRKSTSDDYEVGAWIQVLDLQKQQWITGQVIHKAYNRITVYSDKLSTNTRTFHVENHKSELRHLRFNCQRNDQQQKGIDAEARHLIKKVDAFLKEMAPFVQNSDEQEHTEEALQPEEMGQYIERTRQSKVLTLKSITGFDHTVVRRILQKSDWNLRRAIDAFYIAKLKFHVKYNAQNKPPKRKRISLNPPNTDPLKHLHVFTRHMSLKDAMNLCVNDKIDHRDTVGRFVQATVAEKQGTKLKIHYDGWSRKYDTWCDCNKDLERFHYCGSISERPAHRLTWLQKGDLIDINPRQRHPDFGWITGEIRRLHKDNKSGQVQVVYEGNNGKYYLYWCHLDDVAEVAFFTSKTSIYRGAQPHVYMPQNPKQRENDSNGSKSVALHRRCKSVAVKTDTICLEKVRRQLQGNEEFQRVSLSTDVVGIYDVSDPRKDWAFHYYYYNDVAYVASNDEGCRSCVESSERPNGELLQCVCWHAIGSGFVVLCVIIPLYLLLALFLTIGCMFHLARHILYVALFALNPINKRIVVVEEKDYAENVGCEMGFLVLNFLAWPVIIGLWYILPATYLLSWFISCGAYSKYHMDMILAFFSDKKIQILSRSNIIQMDLEISEQKVALQVDREMNEEVVELQVCDDQTNEAKHVHNNINIELNTAYNIDGEEGEEDHEPIPIVLQDIDKILDVIETNDGETNGEVSQTMDPNAGEMSNHDEDEVNQFREVAPGMPSNEFEIITVRTIH